MLNDEIAELERRLDEMEDKGPDYDAEIADIDSKLADIASQMQLETDPVVRNNLEVSKRFLQMERNHLLVEKTQGTPRIRRSRPGSRFFPARAFSQTWPAPWMPPQARKVIFAPCHRPLTRKVTRLLRTVRSFERRFPPRGI